MGPSLDRDALPQIMTGRYGAGKGSSWSRSTRSRRDRGAPARDPKEAPRRGRWVSGLAG